VKCAREEGLWERTNERVLRKIERRWKGGVAEERVGKAERVGLGKMD
jgi:hypothetical protein